MFEPSRHTEPPSDLVAIIRQVRRRWRMKVALRGAALVLAFGLLLLLVAAWTLESVRFGPAWILSLRIVTAVALAAATGWWLVRPLLRRVTDEQVALYLEEHEPSLQAAIISAVEASRRSPGPGHSQSAALVARLVESAIERCAALGVARGIERVPLRRAAAALGAIALAVLVLAVLGPASFRHAVSALLLVARSVEAAAPYRISVSPGDAAVPRGADQTITATLEGFAVEEASLMVRRAPGAPFEPLPLIRGEDGRYEGILFAVAGPADYFVEAAGVRSRVFTLTTVDLPYVERLELEYHFPPYTGLEPQTIEDGGDIAVLRGTEVRARVIPTMPAAGGRLVIHGAQSAPLAAAGGGALSGRFVVERDGFYRVELQAPSGERVTASPQYTIDVLSDEPPAVSFSKPGRDATASPIEELFVEARAEDDFGVRGLELVYAVNGGEEKVVRLFEGRAPLSEVVAGHTFFLEELNVQPGDAVSYYARAADNDAMEGGKRATSDLYFVRIRPFRKEFREATSQAGGGGAGDAPVDALSQQQRQIIAATFNLQRDRRTLSAQKLRESTVVVGLAQARLREQVQGLLTRMSSQLVAPDPAFKTIAALLPQAVAHMKSAEAKLQAGTPDAALPPEHRALQVLQKIEEEYELQVSVSRNAGGGGAGSTAEDLADLFEHEMDRMASQYETTQRETQHDADQRLDELMEKLNELARRQEQEAERQRRRAAAGQAGSSSGAGGQQRALAEQVEEAARRLERLSREENRPELGESARRLRQAADAMRRAAAGGDASGQASAALDRLRETERLLRRSRSARAARDVQDALEQADDLAREQRRIAEDVRGLQGTGEARRDRVRELVGRKDALESNVAALEQQLDRTAADARRDERETSRRLAEAAAQIRDSRLREKIRYSRAMISRNFPPEAVQGLESDIGARLDALREQLAEAASALGRTKPDAMADALERARRLARGAESLEQRLRERAGREKNAGSPAAEGQSSDARADAGRPSGDDARGRQDGDPRGTPGRGHAARGESPADRLGTGAIGGGWAGGYGAGDWWWGRLTPDDIRQFRGEIRQWSSEVQQLRRLLREEQIDPKELDEIVRALRALDDDRVYKDVAELARLQSLVAERLKRFEYGLRRRADGEAHDIVLSGSDEVPESFRALVEQYYRSLSTRPR